MHPHAEKPAETSVVNSFNEWDPLEEVIVGRIDGAMIPSYHVAIKATMPSDQLALFQERGGQPFPREQVCAARDELEEFVHILKAEGIHVRRPDPFDHARSFSTPLWNNTHGLYSAMPRDIMLVVGNEIIEAPMAWRSRYFEIYPYRRLLKEYFQAGANWVAGPKPLLSDEFYNQTYQEPSGDYVGEYAITELEPTFDAADFIRCGQDIFVQKSHVTNDLGIAWVQRHLPQYRIHKLEFKDSHPMHIDATLMPLAPGKVLVNPERVERLPDLFKTWEVLPAPPPCIPASHTLYMSSRWISMNILMLDEKRVIVEKQETELIAAFKNWGFEPIPCSFRNFNRFGGSFHCATLDVRRRGQLQSYFRPAAG